MEGLAPPLKLVLEIRQSLESGEPVKTGVHRFLIRDDSSFAGELRKWLLKLESGVSITAELPSLSPCGKALISLIEAGLKGQPILGTLKELEQEMIEYYKIQIEEHLAKLPIKMLVPLIFLQFPAFLLLLFGPLLKELLKSL